MKKLLIAIFYIILILPSESLAQETFIRTKEGRPILNRKALINNCLKSLHKDKTDETALSICECQVKRIDKYFTNKQYKQFTKYNVVDISSLTESDSLFAKKIQECYTSTGKTMLLQAEGFETEYVANCIKGIQKNTEKQLDNKRLTNFCKCQLDMVKKKRLTDIELNALQNPNSLLFYEMIYNCGNPFSEKDISENNWNINSEKDISGPETDTVSILNINGMTYIKLKIGSLVQIWLFDTGASDLMINKDMEEQLKNEKTLTETDYLGEGEYEMANGTIDTCRKYKLNNIKIGQFTVNNITVAVSDKANKIIVGKTLLNKFGNWLLNNKSGTLILNK
jgi:hypothetical protein